MNSNKIYTRREVAAIFKVTVETIDNWRDNGVINSIKIGSRAIRFTQDEVTRLLEQKNGTH